MTLKPCSTPGCPGLTRRGGKCGATCCAGRCRAQSGTQESAGRRGYDSAWRKVRDPYIAAHPVCVDCGAASTIADHLDGLGPLGPRGSDWSNLEAVCKRCHNRRSLQYDGAWGNPRRPRSSTTSRCRAHLACLRGGVHPATP